MPGKANAEATLEFREPGIVVVHGIGKPKTIELPEEVVEWLRKSIAARRVLEELVTHYKYRTRLSNPRALRSLILLLYSRAHGIPPYKTARIYGVAPEQLYRMERGLKKDGLYEFVIDLLSLEETQNP
ncbi:MAG: hypothetical protein GSR73_05025 [Desulfurococcales archaeon]|nr:hypothetical protein [Desulfurococcales archaeon]